MKLIKIGSAPVCDLVLNSEFVSAHHADITVLDNGEILIEDKNSTNGTFIGNKKIKANQEVPVKRGDYVRFGDTDIVWSRIPQPEKNTKYKSIINIGSNFRNDVVVNNETVSRYHATLKVQKDGKVFIVDNGSKNGTQVNGVRVQGLTRVKKGDNVLCGEEDVSEAIKQYFPPTFPKWAWWSSGVVGIAAVIALVFLLLPDGDIVRPEQIRPTVVYVRATFHFNLTLEDSPFTDAKYNELLTFRSRDYSYQATAFFIDDKGHMATNRHVAVPWMEEYRPEGLTETLKQEYQEWLLEEVQVPNWQLFFTQGKIAAVRALQRTSLGQALVDNSGDFSELQAKIKILESSKIVITGQITDITVGYPGKNYTHYDEFQRCAVICESGNKDIDLAILQLNDKKTPNDIVNGKTEKGKPIVILNPANSYTQQLVPLEDKYMYIGYPYGLAWGLDTQNHSLEPTIGTTQCSKEPGRYTFEFRSDAKGGSSGSPIFNQYGQLIGILSSGYEGESVTFAVHARYLKKMYEEEIDFINAK